MSMQIHPRWLAIAPNGHDHLAVPRIGMLSGQQISWCGLTLADTARGGSRPRCQDCLRILRKFTEEATAPLPDMVTEKVVVTVTRPAGKLEDTAETIARRLAPLKTWKVHIEP